MKALLKRFLHTYGFAFVQYVSGALRRRDLLVHFLSFYCYTESFMHYHYHSHTYMNITHMCSLCFPPFQKCRVIVMYQHELVPVYSHLCQASFLFQLNECFLTETFRQLKKDYLPIRYRCSKNIQKKNDSQTSLNLDSQTLLCCEPLALKAE